MSELIAITDVYSLAAADLRALADSHMTSLPASSLSQLGEEATIAFYRFVAGSKKERLLIARKDEAIVAACVLSFAPETIKLRLVLHIPTVIALVAATLKKKTASSSGDARPTVDLHEDDQPAGNELPLTDPSPKAPEVLHIFAHKSCRGSGIGRRLMEAAEKAVFESGYPRIVVQTQASRDNPALKFYESLDYTPCSVSTSSGKTLVKLEKNLAN